MACSRDGAAAADCGTAAAAATAALDGLLGEMVQRSLEQERQIEQRAGLAVAAENGETEQRPPKLHLGTDPDAGVGKRAPQTPSITKRKKQQQQRRLGVGDQNWQALKKTLCREVTSKKAAAPAPAPHRKRPRVAPATAAAASPARPPSSPALTSVIALDCEFVGVGADTAEHALARVSVVNYAGEAVLDRHVRVDERVTDFRTRHSGIQPRHLRSVDAIPFKQAQAEVARLLQHDVGSSSSSSSQHRSPQGRVLVGHGLATDMRVLLLSHPHRQVRDTARYRPLRARINMRRGMPALRRLAAEIVGVDIQQRGDAGHDSVQDARAALALYKMYARQWEEDVAHDDPDGKRRVQRQQRQQQQSLRAPQRPEHRRRGGARAE